MINGKILIVEDEKNLGITLQEYLSGLGHNCRLATDVKSAKEIFSDFSPKIILMDIGLPDGNGLDLAREFRASRKDFVLLFLSAQNDPETRVEGLEIGAEDYITKPFALKELVLRLNRILEHQESLVSFADEIQVGDLKIWFKKFEIENALGETIPMSQKECSILELLMANESKATTREEIIEKIWGEDKFPSNRTVDNYIVSLRKWCETSKQNAIEIKSIRGIGYKLICNSKVIER
ncbi:two-component system, transcriptional regulatory protein [Halobacteriovorax marinus SJ]|uniref:Two-component system, transcriptional regulatory protein n=1 Tax=Halobacteriovorax marinus (strain ATCC BAA-682 / DSM 15412 / SJ) TaxID=862908 RepID=E1X325_HALMS|nr:response regulator transcription factor [Halobacteriovorax marinus]CBW26855.1 two-component system, transcriptional regulatory protein [Halobacteriovorax marinus SJ]